MFERSFPRCAPKVWSALTEREGGGTTCGGPSTPPQRTYTRAYSRTHAGSEKDDRYGRGEPCRTDPRSAHWLTKVLP